MKAILQRVHSASVTVEQQLVSQINKGVLVFAAVGKDDTPKEAETLAAKVLKLRMWSNDDAMWKKNVVDIGGEVLCVSQFTLYGATNKGTKPSFHKSANGDTAKELYNHFVSRVQELYEPTKVKTGVFQAMMDVALVNDGPVTLELEVEPAHPNRDNKQ